MRKGWAIIEYTATKDAAIRALKKTFGKDTRGFAVHQVLNPATASNSAPGRMRGRKSSRSSRIRFIPSA